jgi:hypothetical protein
MNPAHLIADLRGKEPDQADQRIFDAEIKLPMPGHLKRLLAKIAERKGLNTREYCRQELEKSVAWETSPHGLGLADPTGWLNLGQEPDDETAA